MLFTLFRILFSFSSSRKILVLDFNGRPFAKEDDSHFKEKLFGLMGISVSANGDVWVADGSGDQLLYFPGGRNKVREQHDLQNQSKDY